MSELVRIKTTQENYIIDYPQAVDAGEKQLSILWFAKELGVDKDESDIRTKCTSGERYGITYLLKIFNKYELMLGGDEFWGGKVQRMFPREDIGQMCAVYAMVERAVHAPFYDLINKTLNIATEEFYNEWKEDPILSERIAFISKYAAMSGYGYKDLLSLGAFAFMEGAVLFSAFSFLKSFNTGGYNMIPHTTSGIDASAKDENFHSMSAAWLFNQYLSELIEAKQISPEEVSRLFAEIRRIAQVVYDHELAINTEIFSKGGIRTTTIEDQMHFVRNRIDVVLAYLQQPALYGDAPGKISEWFYSALSTFKYADFFSNSQVQYVRNWNKRKLTFRTELA